MFLSLLLQPLSRKKRKEAYVSQAPPLPAEYRVQGVSVPHISMAHEWKVQPGKSVYRALSSPMLQQPRPSLTSMSLPKRSGGSHKVSHVSSITNPLDTHGTSWATFLLFPSGSWWWHPHCTEGRDGSASDGHLSPAPNNDGLAIGSPINADASHLIVSSPMLCVLFHCACPISPAQNWSPSAQGWEWAVTDGLYTESPRLSDTSGWLPETCISPPRSWNHPISSLQWNRPTTALPPVLQMCLVEA